MSASVVQAVASSVATNVASIAITVTSTGAGNALVAAIIGEAGTTAYTSFSATDNKGNTWVQDQYGINAGRHVGVLSCLSPATSGVTTVTITPNGGTGLFFGQAIAFEVSGLGTAVDQSKVATIPGVNGTSQVITAAGSDTTAAFVVAAMSLGTGLANEGFTLATASYTLGFNQNNDSSSAAGECSYRVNAASGTTDSATWATPNNTGAGGEMALVSYKAAAGGSFPPVPQSPWASSQINALLVQ